MAVDSDAQQEEGRPADHLAEALEQQNGPTDPGLPSSLYDGTTQ